MKILIVEDDLVIAESLANELFKWNYEVVAVDNFEQIMEDFHEVAPPLVLLDINLPTLNGFHWCQEMRKESNVPIMFISSRIDNMDQIMAIQMGGDDFIEKPFNLSLTVAKIQALLRRTYDLSLSRNELGVKGCKLILDEAKIINGDDTVQLSLTELQILKLLFQSEDKYVNHTALIEKCWESENFIDDNTLAVNMTRLRKKLLFIGLTDFIETKKNVGYRV
ncbi:response regulator transcription factor [Staphylococcus saccharolyticus]|uniref:response regulator transcription factor n=1 Tax=Staphylococcus saccharolyticus TaxID=33028 RepID=UPI00102DDDED|nr:response regulator transcription factor [Staphylococcus saccharolyticus]MBL7573809.1 response regulator transcription factor [Staphylococcus saccharolyticus]MBL7584403.1 response regulator transcription factor [Staphylococcus saccharolyticus]MBL7639266.1 response regulator transcription factor [Staphylococcus saccharolyticus]QRJ68588.1 response regulator transcription factor [Staphylococcus saccharolyticus]TAA91903.1 DNA-binding response regulator [Staphylococcus saccharolyticus]